MKNKFKERIKEIRLEKGYTQQTLAEKLGYKRNTISQWETIGKEPNLDTICELSKLLGYSADYLLGIED